MTDHMPKRPAMPKRTKPITSSRELAIHAGATQIIHLVDSLRRMEARMLAAGRIDAWRYNIARRRRLEATLPESVRTRLDRGAAES